MLFEKIKNNRIVKNASWLIAGKIMQMLLSLVVGIIAARYLGPSNYGLINYGTAFASLFMAFCTLGINSVIVKEFVDNPEEQGKALGTAIFYRFISSALSIVLIFCASLMLDYGSWETILVTVLCSLSLLFHAFDTINYWFLYKQQSKVTAIVTFVAYLFTSIYKIVLLIQNKSVFYFALASFVDYLVLGVLLLLAYKKYNGQKLGISLKKGNAILKKSYHYILSGMMVAIYGQTDKLMLKQMLSEESVGYYSTATAICGMWTFVLSAIIDAIYPTIIQAFKTDKNEFDRKNRQLYAIVFYLSSAVSVLFLIFGDLIIKILYGEAFLPAAQILKVVTWYTAFSFLGVAREAWVVCNDKQKYLKYIYISACVVNIALNMLFIPLLGATGAALASLVTQICTGIIFPFFVKDLRPNAILMLDGIRLKGFFNKK